MPTNICLIFLGTAKKSILQWWKQKSSWQNEGQVEWGNYWRVCWFEGKNEFIETKKNEMKNAKGVKKNVVKKDISLQDYVGCLFEEI